jgi:erythromycin esterase
MPDDVAAWLANRAILLGSLQPDSEPAELEPLRAILKKVRLVGIGEATHGSAEFFQVRWRLMEFLSKELDFTTLAIEASAAASLALDQYVRHGTGDPREALAGLGFWTWNTTEMLTVIERLREHNRTAAHPVRVVGIDPQHAVASLQALRAVLDESAAPLLDPLDGLKRTGLEGPWKPLDPRIEADARRLEEHVAVHGSAEAHEHARIVRQAADVASKARTAADLQALGVVRDRYMAENVSRLMAEPDAKVVVWAHNGHIMKGAYSGGGVPAMGSHLAREFGEEYYALGVLFGEGEFRAHRQRFGRMIRGKPPARFRIPLVDTPRVVEGRLAAASPGDYMVDLRGGDRPEPVADWLAATNHTRGFGGVAGRLTAKFAFMPTVLAEQYDGLAFLRQVNRSTPL